MLSSTDVLASVQVLTFDVMGTVVDWHSSVSKAVREKALRSEATKSILADKGIASFFNNIDL